MTDKIIFTDRGGLLWALTYATQVWGYTPETCNTCIMCVRSWEDLALRLSRLKVLSELVLFFHGAPGQLKIGYEQKDIGEAVKQGFFREVKTKVDRSINLEGCTIGRNPIAMLLFAQHFQAPITTAYTYYLIKSLFPIRVQKSETAESLSQKLKGYLAYLVPTSLTSDSVAVDELQSFAARTASKVDSTPCVSNISITKLAKKLGMSLLIGCSGERQVCIEWFREDPVEGYLPPPPKLGELGVRYRIKRRSDATVKEVTTKEQAVTMAAKYAVTIADLSFDKVVVKMA